MTGSSSPNFNQVKLKPLATLLWLTTTSAYMQTHLPHNKLNNKFYDIASVHIVDNSSSPPNPPNHAQKGSVVPVKPWLHESTCGSTCQLTILGSWLDLATWQCRWIHWSSTLDLIFSVVWHPMSPWWRLFIWHFSWITEQILLWILDEFIHWPNPFFSCQQLVLKYCHEYLNLVQKSLGEWQWLQHCKSILIQFVLQGMTIKLD